MFHWKSKQTRDNQESTTWKVQLSSTVSLLIYFVIINYNIRKGDPIRLSFPADTIAITTRPNVEHKQTASGPRRPLLSFSRGHEINRSAPRFYPGWRIGSRQPKVPNSPHNLFYSFSRSVVLSDSTNSIKCERGNWGIKFTPSHRIRILILVLSKIDLCGISTVSLLPSIAACVVLFFSNRENDEIEHPSSCYLNLNLSSLRVCQICCVFDSLYRIGLCFLPPLLPTYLSMSDIVLIAILFSKSWSQIYLYSHEDKLDD